MSKPLSRRTLLRGVAGLGIGLPLLEAMLPRSAKGAMPLAPRRIMFVFKANRFLGELENFEPEILRACTAAWQGAKPGVQAQEAPVPSRGNRRGGRPGGRT